MEKEVILKSMIELCDVFLEMLGFNNQSLDDDESMECPPKETIDMYYQVVQIRQKFFSELIRGRA